LPLLTPLTNESPQCWIPGTSTTHI
jgi:hypothetical protein